MNTDIRLTLTKRIVNKKDIRKLRTHDLIPGVIIGKGIESIPIQVDYKEFEAAYKITHGTSMMDLVLDNIPYKALIHSLHRDKISHRIRHVDFYKVDLKEKVSVEAPLVMIGHSPMEETGLGVVSQQIMSLHVKCLPDDIPNEITIDRAQIQTKEGYIRAGDIVLPAGVVLANEHEREKIVAVFMHAKGVEGKVEEVEAEVKREVSESSS